MPAERLLHACCVLEQIQQFQLRQPRRRALRDGRPRLAGGERRGDLVGDGVALVALEGVVGGAGLQPRPLVLGADMLIRPGGAAVVRADDVRRAALRGEAPGALGREAVALQNTSGLTGGTRVKAELKQMVTTLYIFSNR